MKYSALLSPKGMAAGGIAATQGRHVQGPGTGRSDSIPAVIDGKEPAALSNGEYVIPEAVVTALGKGSNEAGAKILDDMVARIKASLG